MANYKIWIFDFNGSKNWMYVLHGLGIRGTRGVLTPVPRFTWLGPAIELTTFSNPLTGVYEQAVIPEGFGHISYIGIKGTQEKADLAVRLIKQYTKYVPA
jgi:hypothetical protein